MRTSLGIVAVVGIAAMLAACEEGPVATPEPERHAIEGTWNVLSVTVTRGGNEVEIPPGAGVGSTMEFMDGSYVTTEAGRRIIGTYFIDEQTKSIIVSEKFQDERYPRNRVVVIQYELHGSNRATFQATFDDNLDLTLIFTVERAEG